MKRSTRPTPDRCSPIINVGTGVDVTIREMSETMKRVVGFEGKLRFDTSKPDGAPRKLIDVSRLSAIGWRYSVNLEEGLMRTYAWYLETEIN